MVKFGQRDIEIPNFKTHPINIDSQACHMRQWKTAFHLSHWPFSGSILVRDGISCKKPDSLKWFSVILFPMIPNECPNRIWGIISIILNAVHWVSALWRIAGRLRAVSLTKRGFFGGPVLFPAKHVTVFLLGIFVQHEDWTKTSCIMEYSARNPWRFGIGIEIQKKRETSSQMMFQFLTWGFRCRVTGPKPKVDVNAWARFPLFYWAVFKKPVAWWFYGILFRPIFSWGFS